MGTVSYSVSNRKMSWNSQLFTTNVEGTQFPYITPTYRSIKQDNRVRGILWPNLCTMTQIKTRVN